MKNTQLIALLVAVTTISAISADSYYAGAEVIDNPEMSTYRRSANDYYEGAVTPVREPRPVRDSAGRIVRGTGSVVAGTGRTAGDIVREPVRTTGDVVEGAGRTTGRVVEGAAEVPGKVLGGIFGPRD